MNGRTKKMLCELLGRPRLFKADKRVWQSMNAKMRGDVRRNAEVAIRRRAKIQIEQQESGNVG